MRVQAHHLVMRNRGSGCSYSIVISLKTRVGEAGKTYSCSRHCLGNDPPRGPDLRSRDITLLPCCVGWSRLFFIRQRRARESIMMTMHDMINADRVTDGGTGTSRSSTLPEIGLLPDVRI